MMVEYTKFSVKWYFQLKLPCLLQKKALSHRWPENEVEPLGETSVVFLLQEAKAHYYGLLLA